MTSNEELLRENRQLRNSLMKLQNMFMQLVVACHNQPSNINSLFSNINSILAEASQIGPSGPDAAGAAAGPAAASVETQFVSAGAAGGGAGAAAAPGGGSGAVGGATLAMPAPINVAMVGDTSPEGGRGTLPPTPSMAYQPAVVTQVSLDPQGSGGRDAAVVGAMAGTTQMLAGGKPAPLCFAVLVNAGWECAR